MALTEAPLQVKTGDATYTARAERFNYVVERLKATPKPTYEAIGKELGISKQNVARLVKRGGVKPSGRPYAKATRAKKLRTRLEVWQGRRLARLVEHKDVTREEAWIARIEQDLVALT